MVFLNNFMLRNVTGSTMYGRQTSILFTLALLAGAALFTVPAWGQAGAKIRPPSRAEINAAKSVLHRGLAVLIESDARGGLKQVNIYGRINAPQKTVFDVISDPNALPAILPCVTEESIEVRESSGNATTYRWYYDGTLTDFGGVTSQATAAPAAVQWMLQKAFGPGQMLWRLYPDGDQTIVALAMNIHVTKSAHSILRWLSRANPSQPQAFNVGHGSVTFRGVQHESIKRAGRPPLPPPTGRVGSGPMRPLNANEIKALAPLLKRGVAGVIEQDARGRVKQSALALRVNAPAEKMVAMMNRPGGWGSPVEGVDILIPEGDTSGERFVFRFSFPVLTVSTDMNLTKRPDGIDLESPTGQLKGTVAAWRVIPEGATSVISGASRFKVRDSHRIVRNMVDEDPYFGHAINASCLAIWARFFKLAIER